jgi:hypothetical protein
MSPKTQNSTQIEGRIVLAISALQKNPRSSVKSIANAYNVPRTTLRRRLNGCTYRPDNNAQKRRLLPSEEQVLVQWVLEKDSRGFPPHLVDIAGMAARLIAARTPGSSPPKIGKNWASRFVKTQPELAMDLLQRSSQSPSEAVNRLVKGCQIAMGSAVILAAENHELRKLNSRRKAKQAKPAGTLGNQQVLQAQQGQFLLEQRAQMAENAQVTGNGETGVRRLRAAPTCSICHMQYHTARTCSLRPQ